ncbi:MAG: sporulation peptidase YabG [Hydrogenibacillus sp.]|nr:sporulation peptidase YabG [Hydrogenibacillus sp.]
MEIVIGSLVRRKSYGQDIVFRVIQINHAERTAILQGLDVRLLADAPLDDLIMLDADAHEEEASRPDAGFGAAKMLKPPEGGGTRPSTDSLSVGTSTAVAYPGKVLHLDGDARYLAMSMAEYERLGIPAVGQHVLERDMPRRVISLLVRYQPDVLVLTGHDAYRRRSAAREIDQYRHSQYFIETVRRVRAEYERHKDALIIVAGACQSYYEGLMEAGANFASSPARVNIHALDPITVVHRLSFASVRDIVPPDVAIRAVRSGAQGIGGIETRGTLRIGVPE